VARGILVGEKRYQPDSGGWSRKNALGGNKWFSAGTQGRTGEGGSKNFTKFGGRKGRGPENFKSGWGTGDTEIQTMVGVEQIGKGKSGVRRTKKEELIGVRCQESDFVKKEKGQIAK